MFARVRRHTARRVSSRDRRASAQPLPARAPDALRVVGLLPLFTPDAAGALRAGVGAAGRAVLPVAVVAAARPERRAWRCRRVPAAVHATGRALRRGWPARPPPSRRSSEPASVLPVAAGRAHGGLTPHWPGRRRRGRVCLVLALPRARGRLLGARSRARPADRAGRLVRAAVRRRPRAARALGSPPGAAACRRLGAAADAQSPFGAARDDAVHARADRAGQHRRRAAGGMVARPRRPLAGTAMLAVWGGGHVRTSASPAPAAASTSSRSDLLVLLGAGDFLQTLGRSDEQQALA